MKVLVKCLKITATIGLLVAAFQFFYVRGYKDGACNVFEAHQSAFVGKPDFCK